jgi:hypothetical protein
MGCGSSASKTGSPTPHNNMRSRTRGRTSSWRSCRRLPKWSRQGDSLRRVPCHRAGFAFQRRTEIRVRIDRVRSAETTALSRRLRGFGMPAGLIEEQGGWRRERAIDLWGLNSRLDGSDLDVAGALADGRAAAVNASANISGRRRRCRGDRRRDSATCEKRCDEPRLDSHSCSPWIVSRLS